MIDRNRLFLVIAGAVGFVILIVALVATVFFIGAQGKNSAATPIPEVSEEAETVPDVPEITFTKEQERIVRDTAQVVTTWSATTDPAVQITRYTEAGMSPSLVNSFTPIWAEAFDAETTAEVKAAKIGVPTVTDYVPGKEDGTGIFVVSVVVSYEGYQHRNGVTTSIGPADAVWQFALDERTNTVTQVIQPPLSDIAGLQ